MCELKTKYAEISRSLYIALGPQSIPQLTEGIHHHRPRVRIRFDERAKATQDDGVEIDFSGKHIFFWFVGLSDINNGA